MIITPYRPLVPEDRLSGKMTQVSGPLPAEPGWYPDPYDPAQVRWFDGSEWTMHAVAASITNPTAVVQQEFDSRSDDEKRLDEWRSQFPMWDPTVRRAGEPGFDGAGGVGGFEMSQRAVMATRIASGFKHPARVGTTFTLLVLGLLAWGDPVKRALFLAIGAVFVVIAFMAEVHWARQRAHWDRVGKGEVTPE